MSTNSHSSHVPDLSNTASGERHVEPAKPVGPSRRVVLGGAAAVAGGIGMASLLPASFQKALAQPAPAGDLSSIKHIVLYMQENRSFDHYFGTLNGVRGYGDPTVLPSRSGGSLFAQPTSGPAADDAATAQVRPFKVRDAVNASENNREYIASLPHTYPDGIDAWSNGWWDNWIPAKGAATMCSYDRTDLPLQYAVADTFTICDQYFASMQAGTSPNRNYWVAGYSGFEPLTGKRAVDNAAYDEDNHPGYDWVTHAELLQDAGVSWKVYMEWDNYGDNNLEYYTSFKNIMRKALKDVDGGKHQNCTSFYGHVGKLAQAGDMAAVESLLAALDAGVEALPARERDLFNRGLRRSRPESLVDEFRKDAESGNLPTVCYIVPSSDDSEHPGASSPIQSAHITYGLLEVMGDNPNLWQKSAMVYTFDEFDGYFDHVPPPVAPSHHKDEFNEDGNPVGLGARVPTIIVSPWTVGGYVNSEVFDHTSNVKLVEQITGVKTPMISAWRREATGDLTSCFDFSGGQKIDTFAEPAPVPSFTGRWEPQPEATFAPIAIESGTRPARALPYQTMAACDRAAGGKLAVRLSNKAKRPAPMAVYGFKGEIDKPIHSVVNGVASVDVTPVGAEYHVVATGPNGFRADFAGHSDHDPLRIDARTHRIGRQIVLHMFNQTPDEMVVLVNDTSVTLQGGGMCIHPLESADGWFDVEVTVKGDDVFRQHFHGHIENDSESVTGPMLSSLDG